MKADSALSTFVEKTSLPLDRVHHAAYMQRINNETKKSR